MPPFLSGRCATLGDVAWLRCSTCHVPSPSGETDPCAVCKAAAAKITVICSPVSPMEAERALSHSWESEKPTTGDVLLLSYSLAWSCPRTSLCLKGNFSSRCCGDCSFRLYQIRSHLSLLSPNTRNKVPGRRRPRREGPHVSWWLPHWEVTAGREQLGLHRQVAAFVNPAQQSCPSICSQLLRTSPILGPHRASARIFPQAPQRALSSSTTWLVCIKHMAFLGCVSSLRKGMELASHIRLWETGL